MIPNRPVNASLALVATALLLPGLALADATMVFANSDGDGSEESRIEIAEGKIRTDTAGGDGSYMIYRSGSREFILVNPSEQNYMVFDQATVEKVAAAQRRAMEQLEQQLANVPPAQREQMRSMMERMMGGAMPGEAPAPRRYERKGGSQVAGYDCEILHIYIGDRLAAEQCVVDPDALDIPEEDFATMRALQDFMVDLTSQFEMLANQVMDYGEPGRDEMPISYTLDLPMGGKSRGELRSVATDDVDPGRFEIPAGYRRQEMPDLGG